MDDRARTKQRGVRMAMQVAAVSVAVGGAVAIAAADEAAAGEPAGSGEASDDAPGKLTPSKGFSCWAPISRGPLAPPAESDDFDALLAEVPA